MAGNRWLAHADGPWSLRSSQLVRRRPVSRAASGGSAGAPQPTSGRARDDEEFRLNREAHWETVYRAKRADQVSWFRAHLETSLQLIQAVLPDRRGRIIDVGGGESTLVDDLVAQGYANVDVLDLSETALQVAQTRMGARARNVGWLSGDVTAFPLPPSSYDLWHDRAAFHFLTAPEERAAYVRQVVNSVKPGGYAIVATFGPMGPTRCSGLEVVRYSAEALHAEFGASFELVKHLVEIHQTPSGRDQQFIYCVCRLSSRGPPISS